MAGYNPFTNNSDGATNVLTQQQGTFFSRVLKRLSNLGANYDDMIIKNSIAYNINETPEDGINISSGMYGYFSRRATAMMTANQSIASLDAQYPQIRDILRMYSVKDEIRDFISRVCDATIVYNEDKMFCRIKDLPDKYSPQIKQKMQDTFNKLYNAPGYRFGDGITAWRMFQQFIIDGYKMYEIVYDEKQRNIIGFNELDPIKMIPAVDPNTGIKVWVQYLDKPQYTKVILDSNIINIAYSGSNGYAEKSYVEQLIRPYNQLQMLQQSKIMFNLMNATLHKVFTVPVGGMPRKDAEQEVGMMIADYHDEVVFDDTTGQVYMDGQPHLQYSKEYWFPQDEKGKPDFEIRSPSGHDLNESDMLNWFYNVLKRASKIPFTRFDRTNGGGTVFGEGGDITYDDLNFDSFISRLRAVFREIIIKPVYIQMCLDFPELLNDSDFLNNINLEFYGNSQTEKGRRLKNLETRANIASTLMNNLRKSEEEPALHIKFIMKYVMEFTDEELAENEKYFLEDAEAGGKAEGGSGGGSSESGGEVFGGGEGDFGGGSEGGGSEDTGGEIPTSGETADDEGEIGIESNETPQPEAETPEE